MAPSRILMVCMGNICRSPLAEGILRAKAGELGRALEVDSAGTINAHAGEAPDRRAQATARAHGIDISQLRARQVTVKDFAAFDLLLAMDDENLQDLLRIAPAGTQQKVRPIMAYAPEAPMTYVPDPYYGDMANFEEVYALLNEACDDLLAAIA